MKPFPHYKLDDHRRVVECTREEYLEWESSTENRRVGSTHVNGYWVSTVFLGGLLPNDEFFETMVFPTNNEDDEVTCWVEEHCERTRTWEEAEQAHIRAVEKFSDE